LITAGLCIGDALEISGSQYRPSSQSNASLHHTDMQTAVFGLLVLSIVCCAQAQMKTLVQVQSTAYTTVGLSWVQPKLAATMARSVPPGVSEFSFTSVPETLQLIADPMVSPSPCIRHRAADSIIVDVFVQGSSHRNAVAMTNPYGARINCRTSSYQPLCQWTSTLCPSSGLNGPSVAIDTFVCNSLDLANTTLSSV